MTVIRRHRWLQALVLIAPAAVWAVLFIIFPVIQAGKMSLSTLQSYHLVFNWSLASFETIFSNPLYTEAIERSVRRGLIVAVLAVALSLPLAHFISFRVKRRQFMWFGAVVLALWLGYLLNIVGFRILLGTDGALNGVLRALGILSHPSRAFLFNEVAVIIVQTHFAMSFSFIPIFVVMQRVPHRLMQAAADLGAPRWRQILEVELPLIAMGVWIAGVFAFVLSFGDYIGPTLVGAPGSIGIGNIAASEFEHGLDWPLGAAIGLVMTAVVLLALAIPGVALIASRRLASLRQRRQAAYAPDTPVVKDTAIA
jgi:spermidine/putrescine transport system permease protein